MKRTTAFWAGVLAMVSTSSLVQDIEGQQEMLHMVRDHWTSGWYTIPVALVGFIVGVWFNIKATEEDARP